MSFPRPHAAEALAEEQGGNLINRNYNIIPSIMFGIFLFKVITRNPVRIAIVKPGNLVIIN